MNMLVQPVPLPEEIDRGYLGRVMRANSYRSPKEMMAAIAAQFGEDGRVHREITTHELLSRMAGMTTEHFAQQHTTLPLRRGVTSYFPELIHGSVERRSLLRISGTLRKYPAAFFCKECVRADIQFHGTSYWRRDLQTSGQMWCPKHMKPLHFVASDNSFIASPAMFLEERNQIPEDWIQPALANEYVLRFLEIAAALFDRHCPLSVARIAPLLRDMGQAQGFKSNPTAKKGALISDRVKELFPERWLSAVFHELVAKEPRVYLHQIDGSLYLRTSASSTIAYLLVFAVLFDSADQAINALTDACKGKMVPALRLRSSQRAVVPCKGELLAKYVESKGSHMEVARQLELPIHTIRKALYELGLPSLPEFAPDSDTGVVSALRAFYLNKRSYAASFELSGMSVQSFDTLVRRCGPNLAIAFELMNPRERSRPRARQAKGLLPSLVSDVSAAPAEHQVRETLLQN